MHLLAWLSVCRIISFAFIYVHRSSCDGLEYGYACTCTCILQFLPSACTFTCMVVLEMVHVEIWAWYKKLSTQNICYSLSMYFCCIGYTSPTSNCYVQQQSLLSLSHRHTGKNILTMGISQSMVLSVHTAVFDLLTYFVKQCLYVLSNYRAPFQHLSSMYMYLVVLPFLS